MPRSRVKTKLKEILPTSLFADVMELAAEEPEFFGDSMENHVCETPDTLIENYGIVADRLEGENSCYEIPDTMTDPVDIINHVLTNNAHWGEFLGGTVGALTHFDAATRDRILPTLRTAVGIALRDGVDH